MTTTWKISIAVEAVFVAAAIYGGIQGSEAALGAGAAGALLGLALFPALAVRAKRRRQIGERQDALIRFEYSVAEAEEIVAAAIPAVCKQSVRLSILFSVCFAVIFAPFLAIAAEKGSVPIALLCAAAACVVLPWLSVAIAPAVSAHTIRKVPCVSFVGRSCVLIANRYPGINDRYALVAETARFEPGKDGGMAVMHVRYRFRAGKVSATIRHWVDVPVPHGREAEAAALSSQHTKPKQQKNE